MTESTNLSETYTTGQAVSNMFSTTPTLQAYDHQGVAAEVRQTRRRDTYGGDMEYHGIELQPLKQLQLQWATSQKFVRIALFQCGTTIIR